MQNLQTNNLITKTKPTILLLKIIARWAFTPIIKWWAREDSNPQQLAFEISGVPLLI